jgi:hypothetical protein
MHAVGLDVVQIVEAVDRTADETECKEHDERRQEKLPPQQVGTEEDGCKHKSVLNPLQRT